MTRLFQELGTFIVHHRLLVIIVSLALIVPGIFGAMQLNIETGYETFITPGSKTYQDFERFNEDFGIDSIIVLVTGDDITQLLQPDNLAAMEAVENGIGENPEVIAVIGPTFFIKQAVAQQTGTPALPDDLQTLLAIVTDPQTGEIREGFEQVFPDNKHAFISIVLEGGLTPNQWKEVVDEVESAVAAAGFSGVETVVTGMPVIMGQMEDMMMDTMSKMFVLSIILMLVILALVFSVRGFFAWRWLPLGMVLLGIIYTMGIMGALSIPITMVTMAVFPILIGLGIDYSIQIHNRHDEEAQRNETPDGAVKRSLTHIGPAVGTAVIAACLGFAALFFSPMPMIQDFGIMLIIGVIACYIVAMFLLPAILYSRDRRAALTTVSDRRKNMRKRECIFFGIAIIAACVGIATTVCLADPALADFKDILTFVAIGFTLVALLFISIALYRHINRVKPSGKAKVKPTGDHMGLIERGLHRLAPRVIKNPAIIIPFVLILTVVGLIADFQIETETDEAKFISQDVPIMQEYRALEELAGGMISANLLVEAEDVTEPAILEWMMQLQNRIGEEQAAYVSGTNSVVDTVIQSNGGEIPPDPQQVKETLEMLPPMVRSNLISDDYTAANIVVSIREMDMEDIKELMVQLEDYIADHPAGISVAVTGMPVIGVELMDALTGGRLRMTLIGIGLILLGLFIVFRFNLIRALLCTLPILLIIGWSSGLMYILDIKFTPLTAALGALIIAIGVEFTILLVNRYYEERGKGEQPVEAMTTAMTKIGRAIVVSALTTIGGFSALLIATDFTILQNFGIVIMIDVFFALASTVLVLPALVVWVDSRQERRRLARSRRRVTVKEEVI